MRISILNIYTLCYILNHSSYVLLHLVDMRFKFHTSTAFVYVWPIVPCYGICKHFYNRRVHMFMFFLMTTDEVHEHIVCLYYLVESQTKIWFNRSINMVSENHIQAVLL